MLSLVSFEIAVNNQSVALRAHLQTWVQCALFALAPDVCALVENNFACAPAVRRRRVAASVRTPHDAASAQPVRDARHGCGTAGA